MSRKATSEQLKPYDQALYEFHKALNRPQDSKAADEAERFGPWSEAWMSRHEQPPTPDPVRLRRAK